jgi:hypothetical protein
MKNARLSNGRRWIVLGAGLVGYAAFAVVFTSRRPKRDFSLRESS